MKWTKHNRKYWEVRVYSLAEAPLARIFRAIIQCDGKVHDTFCMEKRLGSPDLVYANRDCAATLIISLPVGSEEDFERISKCKLIEPKTVTTNESSRDTPKDLL